MMVIRETAKVLYIDGGEQGGWERGTDAGAGIYSSLSVIIKNSKMPSPPTGISGSFFQNLRSCNERQGEDGPEVLDAAPGMML